jgi:hypothetical protein
MKKPNQNFLNNQLVLVNDYEELKKYTLELNLDLFESKMLITNSSYENENFFKNLGFSRFKNSKLLQNKKSLVILSGNGSQFLKNNYLDLLDFTNVTVLTIKGKNYFKNHPLFLISIPKSGTHLLYKLVKLLGYEEAQSLPFEIKEGGKWYTLEYSNSHTLTEDFFVDSVRRSPFGNRLHEFPYSPALFIYRNPISILSSEVNYYSKEGKTSFFNFFTNMSYDQIYHSLINHPFLGSIRYRIKSFSSWLNFPNVIPLSFEELIGSKGDGRDDKKNQSIWSLILRLEIDKSVCNISGDLFDSTSPTFNKGKISYNHITKQNLKELLKLDQDFMSDFGYTLSADGKTNIYSIKIREFLERSIHFSEYQNNEPVLIESQEFFSIVKYKKFFYGIPSGLGPIDISQIDIKKFNKFKFLKKIYVSQKLIDLKRQIVFKTFLFGFIFSAINFFKRR